MKEKIKSLAQDFFHKLQVNIKSLDVIEETDSIFLIKLESDDSSILIGPYGANIDALQRIISMLINNISEERVRTKLEINDYFKSKDERLFSYIDSKIEVIERNGGEYRLPKYSPYERKKVHSYIAKLEKNIISKSKGEGEDRRLFLMRKIQVRKLSIDIDGDSI